MENYQIPDYNQELKDLIQKYANKITLLKERQKIFEKKSMGGACVAYQGEIQAYNAVLSDLRKLIR